MKPIIFNTAMVQAILSGKKTQTRRVITPQPNEAGMIAAVTNRGDSKEICVHDKGLAPYQPGDVLWVRETWCKLHNLADDLVTPIDGTEKYYYRADGENPTPYNTFLRQRNGYDEYTDCPAWKPSIHMPREAARIFLRVTDVKAERLQEISETDAKAEGCYTFSDKTGDGKFEDIMNFDLTARDTYIELWDSLYAKRGYGWLANPWVWVYSFERVKKDETNI